jgi:lysophospholipase L1-like esterase
MSDCSFPPQNNFDTLVYKKYKLRIDKNGFIIPSERYLHPDISLVFLGGSTTVCHYLDEDVRFPYLTGVLLENKLGIKINSYNAGRSGNNSLHSIDILLNKILPLNPKIVVMMHNINDVTTLVYERSYWNNNPSKSVIIDTNNEITTNYLRIMRDRLIPNIATQIRIISNKIKDKLNPGHANSDEFAHIRGKEITINKTEAIEQFEMNLDIFINICRARKIIPVLMTMPSRIKDIPDVSIADIFNKDKLRVSYKEFKAIIDAFNESIRNKAKENHILFVDLAKDIPQEAEYMYDTVHYTETGSKQIAHRVSEHLEPIIKALVRDHNR